MLSFSLGSMDPYQRAPRSPKGKRPMNLECVSQTPAFNEEVKSPTIDQVGRKLLVEWAQQGLVLPLGSVHVNLIFSIKMKTSSALDRAIIIPCYVVLL